MKERGGLEGGFAEASADRVSRRVVAVAVLGVGEGVWRQVSIVAFESRECENDNKRECWKFLSSTFSIEARIIMGVQGALGQCRAGRRYKAPGHLKTKVNEVNDIQNNSRLRTRRLIHLAPTLRHRPKHSSGRLDNNT